MPIAIVLCLLFWSFSASAGAQQPRDDNTQRQLTQAIDTFFSPDQDLALREFTALVDAMDRRPTAWSVQDHETMTTALAHRSQLLLNADDRRAAEVDLLRLAQMSPEFQFDTTQVSPKVIELMATVRSRLTASLVVVAPTGRLTLVLDSRRVDRVGAEIPVVPGFHLVEIRQSGELASSLTVDAVAGSVATVDGARQLRGASANIQEPQRVETSRQPNQPQPGRSPAPSEASPAAGRFSAGAGSESPRIVLAGSFTMFAVGRVQSSAFTQTIYGKVASLSLVNTPHQHYGLAGFGAAVRVGQNFGVGVHYTITKRVTAGQLSGTIPSPRSGGAARSFSGAPADFERDERAWHLEGRWQSHLDNSEWAAFVGPSFTSMAGTSLGYVTVQEGSTGEVKVTPVGAPQTTRKVGVNFGVDASWFPTPHVGIGLGVRGLANIERLGDAWTRTDDAILASAGLRFRF